MEMPQQPTPTAAHVRGQDRRLGDSWDRRYTFGGRSVRVSHTHRLPILWPPAYSGDNLFQYSA